MTPLDQQVAFDEFTSYVAGGINFSLRAHLAGGHAELHRYTNAAEKALIAVGDYDPILDQTYDWPAKTAAAVPDLASVRVFVDDALLRYHEELSGAGDTVAPVALYKNRVATDGARGFKTNTSTYPRIAALKDRDVAVGDVVHLVDGGDEQWTYVADLVADLVSPSVGASADDAGNAVSQPNSTPGNAPTFVADGGGAVGGSLQAGTYFIRYSFVGDFGETWASDASAEMTVVAGNIPRVTIPALPTGATSAKIYLSPTGGTAAQCTLYKTGVTGTTTDLTAAYAPGGAAYPAAATQTAGVVNTVVVADVDSSTYSGIADGDITETYTVTCTQASTGGDATTARLSVTSASGRDDASDVTPSAFNSATDIGARGLTMTLHNGGAGDLAIGQTWQVTVREAFARPTHASGGSFTGDADVVYIVKVTRGGLFSGVDPQVTVTTAGGTDSSGPTTVAASGGAVSIGTLGVTITFTGAGLRKNDIYTVAVTGPTAGHYKTLVLGHNLTTALQASSDLTMRLYLRKNIEAAEQRASSPPDVNWEVDAAGGVTLKAGMTAYDASLTDGGVLFACPVEGGTVHIQYRAWLPTLADRTTVLSTPAEVEALFGAANLVPDNPLGYAAKRAARCSNGQAFVVSAIADPSDVSLWQACLDIVEGETDVYSLVPLSRDAGVIAAYRSHVLARSGDEVGGEWRTAWFNLAADAQAPLVDADSSDDGLAVLATLADNPGSAGTQYTYLTLTSGNAGLVTAGVAAGDVVRYLYGVDAFGSPTYSEYLVSQVVNEDTLILATGAGAAVSTPQQVEVWRTLTKSASAARLIADRDATTENLHKRFRFLWPDTVTDEDGQEVEGYFLAAALAASLNGIAPQQGLRNMSVLGFSAAPRSTSFFNNAQLNDLTEAGFVVYTATAAGQVYCRAARTPDDSSVQSREEATVRLDDAVRYLCYQHVADFFGTVNLTADTLTALNTELTSALNSAVASLTVPRVGRMISSGSVTSLAIDETVADRLNAEISVSRGSPLNNAVITLSF